jgi:Flp pilus assembly protein TadB
MNERDRALARILENATQILVALRWAAQAGHSLPHSLDLASMEAIKDLQARVEEIERPRGERRSPRRAIADESTF